MTASVVPVPRIGRFLVELERLERAQDDGIFLVDRFEATPQGVKLTTSSGIDLVLPVDASTADIGDALRGSGLDLQIPASDEDAGLSAQPDVQVQWAQLHYALGAYENAILTDAQVQVLAAQRYGTSAAVDVLRGPDNIVETYSVNLDREIDIGLADTLAFAPTYGLVNGSLDLP